jgi:adenylate cyclase
MTAAAALEIARAPSTYAAPPTAPLPADAEAPGKVIAFPAPARARPPRPARNGDDKALVCDIQHAFSHYVPPRLVEQLMADPRLLNLGGETRDITVLFADVRGFTALAEAMEDDPQRLTRVINALLCPLSEIVMAYGGTIDKYMGDCVMAFWGAPADDPHHADNAVAAARAMLDAMPEINDRVRRAAVDCGCLPPMSIGIGINSGKCVVGNLGCQTRFDYSVLGDPVNVASRLEGLSKSYGVPLLIGEGAAQRLQRSPARELDRITVRGRNGAQAVFTVD